MATDMERNALTASILMIMTGQAAHAVDESAYESYSLSAEYKNNQIPSYSVADPAPVDKAIIGAKSNFSEQLTSDVNLADSFGYSQSNNEQSVQVSANLVSAAVSNLSQSDSNQSNSSQRSSSNDDIPSVNNIAIIYPQQPAYPDEVAFEAPSDNLQQDNNITVSDYAEEETNQLIASSDNSKIIASSIYETSKNTGSSAQATQEAAAATEAVAEVELDVVDDVTEEVATINAAAEEIETEDTENTGSAIQALAEKKPDVQELAAQEEVTQEKVTQEAAVQENEATKANEVEKNNSAAEKLAKEATIAQNNSNINSAPASSVNTAATEKNEQQPAIALPPSRAEVKTPATTNTVTNAQQAAVNKPANKPEATPSMVVKKPKAASDVLKKKDGDASTEKNLKDVFTASEKRYSLLKQGNWGLNYDARYNYYRDSRIDIATKKSSSDILRFRVEEDAQHTLTNSLSVQYGLRDNFTVSADLPIVAKTDLVKDAQTIGLGDVSLGVRWEPLPLQRGRLPLIINGNVSLPTGDSPYQVDRDTSLSTGKGYYSFGGGISTRKFIDPVVLFGSASLNYGIRKTGLNQAAGARTITAVKPNLGLGLALGFAYSLNYDVSLTMSYQQAFSVGSEFTARQRNDKDQLEEVTFKSSDQASATLNMALGVRVSPKTIVNTSVGIGLTEDTPDVSFGVSFPLDFSGFGKKK